MARFLKTFAYVWGGLVVVANLVGIAGAFIGSDSFWEAVGLIQSWYSPFNFLNLLLNVALISPAIGAYMLAERLADRRQRQTPHP